MRGFKRRDRGFGPPGKSQVIWFSIEISIWTPPSPLLEKVGPPEKCLTPSETLIIAAVFYEITMGDPL